MNEEEITLRPVAEADLPDLERLVGDPGALGEYQWYGWSDPRRFRRELAEDGLLGEERLVLAVDAGGGFAGFVAARKAGVRNTARYWNIGAQLVPGARGRGIGTRAQLLLVDYLFAHSPVMRLEADTEVGNLAEQRALEKCGFLREGVQRATTFRDGQWRDVVRYGLLRTDPRPERPL
ncbi:GNAT family N-acetyltransferase [Streptomyces rubellomurinus]|uniref:Alanine acetyltransferase n=1 Tax=Streptomyces rubellomurinus (strain ATCC 31215) TaxID=359131 RepID=A0A0F2T564_STRR3|nr:GNAT family protein [Streptomyces rubellomurinus]KJS58364.1 alanine acetyltransferase [Streptomyces rubellomurinus]